MSEQGAAFHDVRARLGALWQLAALEEWRLPVTSPAHTYGSILALDPTDPGALEANFRRELPNARRGEPRARKSVIAAMRQLSALAADDTTRLALQLRVAHPARTIGERLAGRLEPRHGARGARPLPLGIGYRSALGDGNDGTRAPLGAPERRGGRRGRGERARGSHRRCSGALALPPRRGGAASR